MAALLQEIHDHKLASAIDVYCDQVAFSIEECRELLIRAQELGFGVKLHAEQLSHTGGAHLASELGALSADHLENATLDDWRSLAESGTVAVLLPAAALTLGQQMPKASIIRQSGARFAIATDFNPGTSPAQSLIECAAIASRQSGFTAAESLLAITCNAARALGIEIDAGHLSNNTFGDLVVWHCERLEELTYWMPAVQADIVFIGGEPFAY
jgi:imidazolonepropionase